MKKHADRPERWRACGRLRGGDGAKGRERKRERGKQEGGGSNGGGDVHVCSSARRCQEEKGGLWLQAVNKACVYSHTHTYTDHYQLKT